MKLRKKKMDYVVARNVSIVRPGPNASPNTLFGLE
jgi:hypothetical protein